ncbi:MAG: chromophore lyase CpcT/CpeT, partial [Bacteroidota bacterium]
LAVLLLSSLACQTEDEKNLDLLESYLVGSFNSREQWLRDSSYFNIHLNVSPIWENKGYDGRWLYVEQAAASQLDFPYRQRVYRLSINEAKEYVSAIYLIKDPIRFAGDYKLDNPLSGLTPDSLELKIGCEVILQRTENGFEGQTGVRTCNSELRGASYATSKVVLTATQLTSWDQGFNASGEQVWGAEKGPYIFKRKKVYDD